eukprot:5097939-Amphidinium_carterae.1
MPPRGKKLSTEHIPCRYVATAAMWKDPPLECRLCQQYKQHVRDATSVMNSSCSVLQALVNEGNQGQCSSPSKCRIGEHYGLSTENMVTGSGNKCSAHLLRLKATSSRSMSCKTKTRKHSTTENRNGTMKMCCMLFDFEQILPG